MLRTQNNQTINKKKTKTIKNCLFLFKILPKPTSFSVGEQEKRDCPWINLPQNNKKVVQAGSTTLQILEYEYARILLMLLMIGIECIINMC